MEDEPLLFQIGALVTICVAAVLWWIPAPYGSTFWFGPILVAATAVLVSVFAFRHVIKDRESLFGMAIGATWINFLVMIIVKGEFSNPEMDQATWVIGMLAALPSTLFLLGLAGEFFKPIEEPPPKK